MTIKEIIDKIENTLAERRQASREASRDTKIR